MPEFRHLKRMAIYINETDRWHQVQLEKAIVERLRKEGLSGATVFHGTLGFGKHGSIHTTSIVDLTIDMPAVVVAIDEPERIEAVLPVLQEMVGEGLIVLEDVQALRIQATEPRKSGEYKALDGPQRTVGEFMEAAPSVQAETSMEEAIKLMCDNNITNLPISNREGTLVGVLSGDDLIRQILNLPQGGFNPFATKTPLPKDVFTEQRLADMMKTAPLFVEESDPVVKAIKYMSQKHVTDVPVVRNSVLSGILRLTGILRQSLQEHRPRG